jgi:hypothetical protein
LGVHGVPRGTLDVDLNVFVDDDELTDVFELLEELGVELDREVGREAEGARLYFLSPEALAVFKLLFFRTKDIADLERLVAVREIDARYVRDAIVEMMGHDDERVARWDALVREFAR